MSATGPKMPLLRPAGSFPVRLCGRWFSFVENKMQSTKCHRRFRCYICNHTLQGHAYVIRHMRDHVDAGLAEEFTVTRIIQNGRYNDKIRESTWSVFKPVEQKDK